MKHFAFVTMEFYPLTAGEIGRVIHDMLVAMPSSDRARAVVILVGEALDLALARAAFPDVRFEGLDDVAEVQDSDRYPPKKAYQLTTEWSRAEKKASYRSTVGMAQRHEAGQR